MNYEESPGIVDPSIYETALEISSEVIWVITVENNVSEYSWIGSVQSRRRYNLPDEKTLIDIRKNNLHPEDTERVSLDFQRAWHNSSIYTFEHQYRIYGANKIQYHISDKMKFFRHSDGSVKKVIGVWKELSGIQTQRKNIDEEELQQVNQQLSLSIKQLSEREFILNESQRLAKIASWEYDQENKFMFWSNEMFNIYGVDKSFKINDPLEMLQLYDSSSAQMVSEIFSDTALPLDITASFTTPVGYKKWVRITAYPIFEKNELKRIIGLTYDITHFKEAEERLKRSEEKFAKAFHNNPDLMTIHRESDLLIIDTNKHVERVSGYTREELVGKIARDFNFFATTQDREIFYQEYLKDGEASIETQWRKKDNTIILAQITSTRVEINGESYSLNSIKDITAQKGDKERFQKAFDLSPDLMMVFRERDRTLVDVNTKLESFTGYKRDEVIGRSSNDFAIWANNNERDHYFTALSRNDSVTMDASFRKKSGQHFYGVISTSRIQLSGENHFLTVVRDVTEKKLAEDKIRENEAKLNTIINNTDLSIWSIDTEYKITIFNNAFDNMAQKILGKKFETGMHIINSTRGFLAEENISFWQSLYNRAFTGEIVSEEYEIDGGTSLTSLHPIFSNGKVIGASIYARDITEQKKAEQKLQLSEANLNATVNNTTLFVWSVDREFNIIVSNEPFKEYVKQYYNIDLQNGKQIFPDGDLPDAKKLRKTWTERYNRALTGEIVNITEEIHGFVFEYSLSPIIQSNKVTGVSVFAEDVTIRVQKEKELAEANKKIGEFKLMALRSVMNPHFIFNALNSIQYFILNNDKLNAINYLSTFSKLIRGILNNTVENKIKLSEEIEQLKYYINLEQLRFEDRFIFILNVDTALNTDEIEIPSLLIQPYIENAILHGLCNKKERGMLKVSISETEDAILFEIEDDGVGRAAAMEFRRQNLPKHKSMGTALTEERLKLINAESNVSFEIIDLMKNGEPSGTNVKIWVKEI